MKGALTEIIQLATLDSDPWVLMVADILKSFPDTGSLNLDLEEQNPNVQDILGELREKGRLSVFGLCCRGRWVSLKRPFGDELGLESIRSCVLCARAVLLRRARRHARPPAAGWHFAHL